MDFDLPHPHLEILLRRQAITADRRSSARRYPRTNIRPSEPDAAAPAERERVIVSDNDVKMNYNRNRKDGCISSIPALLLTALRDSPSFLRSARADRRISPVSLIDSCSNRVACRFIPDYLVLTSLEQTRQRRRLKGVICQNSPPVSPFTQRNFRCGGLYR